MNCRQWSSEISERSRRGAAPGAALAHHLAECPDCTARWENEIELSHSLKQARRAASGLHSSPALRSRILAEFDARGGVTARHPRWMWIPLAATLLLALTVGLWKQPALHRATESAQAEMTVEELFADNDFVPIPYALPLAQGEVVEVVRMELSPAALAGMGFITQAGNSGDVTTDLAIGEDGLPRAVRVPESVGIRF